MQQKLLMAALALLGAVLISAGLYSFAEPAFERKVSSWGDITFSRIMGETE